MRWRIGLAVLAAAWVGVPAGARGQTTADAVKAVPEDAAGFVLINDLSRVNDKVVAAAKRVQAPLPFAPLEKIRGELGIDKGLNEKGSVLAVFFPKKGEDGKPRGLLYLPVTDYGAFVQGLGGQADGVAEVKLGNAKKPMLVGKHGSFAVLAEPSAEDLLKRALKAGGGGGAGLAPLQPWLGEVDVAGVLTGRGVKLLAGQLKAKLAEAKDQAVVPPEAKFVLGWFDALTDLTKAAEVDVTHLAVGARADQTGNLDLSARAVFAQGGKFAQAGAKAKAPAGGPLAGLPDVPYVAAFGGGISPALMQGMSNFGTQMLTAMAKDIPPEKVKQLERAAQESAKNIRAFGMVVGVGKGQDPILRNTVGVMKVDDAPAYLDTYQRSLEAYNEVFKGLDLPTKMTFEQKRVKVGDTPAVQVTVDMGANENLPEMQKKFQEMYFGPGGKMVATVVPADKNTVLFTYAAPETVKDLLVRYKDQAAGLAKEQGAQETIGLLPGGTQWVALVSPKGVMDFTNRILGMFQGDGGFQLPAAPATPPVGIGVRLTAAGLEGHLVVPASTQAGVGAYVNRLRKLKGNVGTGAAQ